MKLLAQKRLLLVDRASGEEGMGAGSDSVKLHVLMVKLFTVRREEQAGDSVWVGGDARLLTPGQKWKTSS